MYKGTLLLTSTPMEVQEEERGKWNNGVETTVGMRFCVFVLCLGVPQVVEQTAWYCAGCTVYFSMSALSSTPLNG